MREVDLAPGQFSVLVLIVKNPGVRQSGETNIGSRLAIASASL